MSKPWEQYATASAKPWEQYSAPETSAAPTPIRDAGELTLAEKAALKFDQMFPQFQKTTAPVARGFVQGAADLPVGLYQTIANATGQGEGINRAIAEKEAQSEMLGTSGGARIVGNIASPANLIAASRIPIFTGAKGVGQTAGQLAKNAGVGVGTGAAYGLATPVTDVEKQANMLDTKTGQAGLGALAGGVVSGAVVPALSVAGKAGGLVYDALKGKLGEVRAAKVLREAAGGDLNAMRTIWANAPKEMTAAQSVAGVQNAEIQALGEVAAKAGGTPYMQIAQRQEAARQAALQSVTPEEVFEKGVRSAVAGPMYAAATAPGKLANTSGVISDIDSLIAKKGGNAELVAALTKVRNSLVGQTGKPVANAEYVASALDTVKAEIAKKENQFVVGQLTKLKDDLSQSIPGYEAAQHAFAARSVPVNQAQVLNRMQEVLKSNTDVSERVAPFLNVLGRGEDALIKTSTGAPRYTSLSQILNQPQQAAVNRVSGELMRDKEMAKMATAGMTRLQSIFKESGVTVPIPPIFNKIATAARFGATKAENMAQDKAFVALAKYMQTGKGAKELSELFPASQRVAVLRALAQESPRITPYATAATMGASQ